MPTPNQDTNTVQNNKFTTTTNLMQTDGTTSNGRVVTTVQTSGEGSALVVRMSTSDSGYPPDDTADCVELIEFASDMIGHWTEVKTQLEALAEDIGGSDS